MIRRILLFFTLNIAVVLTLSLILNLLRVGPHITIHGLDTRSLAIFCLVWGMGGAFISLALSRLVAKWLFKVRLIDLKEATPQQRSLLEMVHTLAKAAGLTIMPQVGIYPSSEVNAFATGPTRNRSLVAVSQALLSRLSPEALRGVLAHEISHIANGDMVTMTLLQGVINAFAMFLARVLAFLISGLGQGKDRESSSRSTYTLCVFLFEIVFMFLGFICLAAYSRFREFRADKGGARLAGKEGMILALESLRDTCNIYDQKMEKPALQAMKISNKANPLSFLSTHPPLEIRLKRLREATI